MRQKWPFIFPINKCVMGFLFTSNFLFIVYQIGFTVTDERLQVSLFIHHIRKLAKFQLEYYSTNLKYNIELKGY